MRDAFNRLMGWVFAQWEPVGGGRLFLLASGFVTTVTAPLVAPDARGYGVLAVVSAAMAASLLISFLVPWQRLPNEATAVFPVLVWVALGLLGVGAHGLGANFTGLFSLGFAYLGLSQRVRTIVRLTPLAAVCFVCAYGGWSKTLSPRLLIGVSVWLLLGLLIAELVRRQLVLVGKLRYAAQTDALTGLGNRRNLDQQVALARPGDSIVVCDLDHFKRVNDTQGHAAGDRVLAEFGAVLRACLRKDDHACRYGGEEFALVLPSTSSSQAQVTLRRLRHQWAILQPEVTFSAGIATCRDDRAPDHTLTAADRALYTAKATGRNRDCHEPARQPA